MKYAWIEKPMAQYRGWDTLMCGAGQSGLGVRRAGIGVGRDAERVVSRHHRARGCQDGLREPWRRE